MTSKEKLTSLKFAHGTVRYMHGSVTGDPEFDHRVDPTQCTCEYGDALRGLRELITELQAVRKTERKTRADNRRTTGATQ